MTETTQRPRLLLLLSVAALALFAAACGLSVTTPDYRTSGTVVFVDVEGGCWGIETEDERLEPINLPEAFQRDSLDVRFDASRVEEAASICQIGPLVQIHSIDSIG